MIRHRTIQVFLGISALGIATAGACGESSETPPLPVLPLDQRLQPNEVRAGRITAPSELIGGITAKGHVGDFKLYNDRIAIIVAEPGVARGYNPYGGGILDADVIREPGMPGLSNFGEVITALDLAVPRAERLDVISDGRDGKEARLRAVCEPDKFPLFDAFLGSLLGRKSYDMEWNVDYVLEPNADHVKVEINIFNRSSENYDFGLPIAAFLFGDGAQPYLEGFGFAPPSTSARSGYYAAAAPDVSYIYGRLDSRLTLIVTDSGVMVTGLGGGFELLAREHKTISHYLVVGDGRFSKTQLGWRMLTGEALGAHITGQVKTGTGVPLADARVHALTTTPSAENVDYVTRAATDQDGRYELWLAPGGYKLEVTSGAQLGGQQRDLTVVDGVDQDGIDLSVPGLGKLGYRVVDETGRLLPVKLSVQSADGPVDGTPKRFGEMVPGHGLIKTEFGHKGEGEFELPVGNYLIHASRGTEYEVLSQNVSVSAGASARFDGELRHSVSTPGWMSTDTHIHAQLSPDSPDLYPFKVRTMVVEGLEIPISTEHEAIGDFNPAIDELGLQAWMKGIIGSEITTFTYGHFNAFPLIQDKSVPGNGRIDWYGRKPGATFANIRANPGDPFFQANHPRAAAIGGYFSAMSFDRDAFRFNNEDYSPDFDGIEILNGCGNGTLNQETIQDWFSYLNHGDPRVATASTDNHRAEGGDMGLPRTFVRMPTDVPQEANDDQIRSAFKQGRLTLSCGPFVDLHMGSKEIGDTVTMTGPTIALDARVAAPSWMDVDAIDVVIDGKVVKTVPLTSTEGGDRFNGTITASVTPGRDAWVLLVARGDRPHGIWLRSRPSFALTNPIFLEGDGDSGRWAP